MCMKAKTPDIKQPAPSPTPVAQTDDMAQKSLYFEHLLLFFAFLIDLSA